MNISSTTFIRNDYWTDYNGTDQLNQRIDDVEKPMKITSTPFIRNDYWPDYNGIDQLNQRIDEAENEITLVDARLTNDIDNVLNDLNIYKNEMADTAISNNIIVNNINANYATGRFANFDNTFTNNAYVENLTVNKPVFDITLNTPHLENTTSLGGNFYNANLFDANVSNLYVNISSAPIQSSKVLGYDSEGRVIPIHATYDVGFPENADYLWTNQTGTAFGGVKATEVGEVENLITAYGVKNAIDALNTGVTDNFNLVNDNLNNVYQWQNSFENSVANTFNDVNTNIENNVSTLNNRINDVELNFNALVDTKQPKTLSAPITVGGISSTTVEDALGNLNTLVDTKLPIVTSLPANPSNGEAVLYIGTASEGLKTGGIYQYQISEWVLISYAESFTFNSNDFSVDTAASAVNLAPARRVYRGTKADWDLLSVAEKTQYGATAFTDDEGSGMDSPVDVVESGNMHAVTSNAVANITSSKVGFLSREGTDIIEAFSQVGIPNDFYSKTIKQFCDNISTYSSGVHSLSIGGPAYGFVLWKHDNDHFVIDMLSYSDYADNIIRIIKNSETYTVYRYVK